MLAEPFLIGARRSACGEVVEEFPDPVHDAEAFCYDILHKRLHRWNMFLTPEEEEDALLDLIEVSLKEERKYDPSKSASFTIWFRTILYHRVVDVVPRRLLMRSGGKIPGRTPEQLDERTVERSRSYALDTPWQSSTGADRGTGRGGLQGAGDRRRAGAHAVLRLRAAGRAAAGASVSVEHLPAA